jgi:hypothetical protein
MKEFERDYRRWQREEQRRRLEEAGAQSTSARIHELRGRGWSDAEIGTLLAGDAPPKPAHKRKGGTMTDEPRFDWKHEPLNEAARKLVERRKKEAKVTDESDLYQQAVAERDKLRARIAELERRYLPKDKPAPLTLEALKALPAAEQRRLAREDWASVEAAMSGRKPASSLSPERLAGMSLDELRGLSTADVNANFEAIAGELARRAGKSEPKGGTQ